MSLNSLLHNIGDFYSPPQDEAEKKLGIGHEVEHIKGVVLRADNISDIISNEYKATDNGSPIDKGIVATVAALHDIGNTIERSSHEHMGRGIIQGELSPQDILSVPMFTKENQSDLYGKETILKEYFDIHKEPFSKENLSTLNDKLQTAAYEVGVVCLKFRVGYNTIPASNFEKTINQMFGNDIFDVAMDKFKSIINENKMTYTPELQQCIDSDMGSKLQSLTAQIQQVYPKGSEDLTKIAEAVQDHNIDFKPNLGTGEIDRYEARNVYGSIVADADKDNVFETFEIRTLAFSINKLPTIPNGDYMFEKKPIDGEVGKVDMIKAVSQVFHQIFERFRPNEKDIEVSQSEFAYKTVGKIKGIEAVSADIPGAKVVPETIIDHNGIEWKCPSAGQHYIEKGTIGDDIYSQCDAIYGKGENKVLETRSDFIEKAQALLDDAKITGEEAVVIKIASIIVPVWEEGKTIEEIVAKGEIDYYKEQGIDLSDISWDNVIEYIYRDVDDIEKVDKDSQPYSSIEELKQEIIESIKDIVDNIFEKYSEELDKINGDNNDQIEEDKDLIENETEDDIDDYDDRDDIDLEIE